MKIGVLLDSIAKKQFDLRMAHLNEQDEERKTYAKEILDIYAPLANRLGIGQLKWELEDIAFHYINPDLYKTIAGFLAERRVDRDTRIQNLITFIQENLKDQHIEGTVTGRAKHIYSIYSKAKRNHLNYKDLYDFTAVRILTKEVEDCYKALALMNHLFTPILKEFDDYIAKPKPNGYQSIHTAVIGEDNKHFEIQIRTEKMHEEAERGVAAHWMYKENRNNPADDLNKINYLRQLIDWHREISPQNNVQANLLEQQIYVITPAGDILDLPAGATPLDFAYHIHSDIGNRCRGAKVNGHIVPLIHVLKTGDKVEILTSLHGTPSRDWLKAESGYIKSSRARSKVAHWFRQQDEKLAAPKPIAPIKRQPLRPKHIEPVKAPPAKIASATSYLTVLAKCCNPKSGDEILGYITRGRGISVHKKSCSNIKNFKDTRRFFQITWEGKKS